jgi:hypothetical protein
MLSVFCARGIYADKITSALSGRVEIRVTDRWERFETSIDPREGSIVVIEWLDRAEFRKLCVFKWFYPLTPVALVTHGVLENARFLRELVIEEVIWVGELEHELWPAVQRMRGRGTLRRLAAAFEHASEIPVKLRRALTSASSSHQPFHSVVELAAAVGCGTTTLWHHWKRFCPDDTPIRLEDFIDWVLLFHAASMKVPGKSWSRIAADLGVHEHTLGRIAKRLTQQSLRELSATKTTQSFAAWLQPLLQRLHRVPDLDSFWNASGV